MNSFSKNILQVLVPIFLLSFGMALVSPSIQAQEKERVEILNANKLIHTEIEGLSIRKLLGDVKFKHKGTLMDCDSAYQYEDRNRIEAFSDVRIREGDSMDLTGEHLSYDGGAQKAVISEEVVLKDDSMTLETDTLHYDLRKNNAFYTHFGVIRDGENRLTSKEGYYYANQKKFHFKDSVRLTNPDYKVFTDTMHFERPTTKAYFKGPTEIISDTNYLYCEDGWYHTEEEKARLGKNTCIQAGEKLLYADSLYYNRPKGYGQGLENIRLYDTIQDTKLSGNHAEYFREPDSGFTYVTDSALGRKIHQGDTFYLHADTLRTGFDSTGQNRLFSGYYGARSYHYSLKSQCDSLVYSTGDSLIKMYTHPVIWMDQYQITADHIRIFTDGGGTIKKMKMLNNALMISQIDSTRFNQVKGRNMTAYFNDNELYKIDVEGNGQAIYFLTDKDDKFVGVNEIASSDIVIRVEERQISSINFKEEPEATVFPPREKPASDHRLGGFEWLGKRRPDQVSDLFRTMPLKDPESEETKEDEGMPGKIIERDEP